MDLFNHCKKEISDLLIYVKSQLNNDFVDKLIEKNESITIKNAENLDDIFINICYLINNNDNFSTNISFSIRDYDFTDLNKKLLEMLYDIYLDKYQNLNIEPEKIFTIKDELFPNYDASMLNLTNEIVDSIDNSASKVNIDVKNCKNIIFNTQALLDDEFIKSEFANLNFNTGINETVIKRFQFMEEFPDSGKDNRFVKNLNKDIYQNLSGGKYRKITNNKNPEFDLELMDYNMFTTNWENRRIMALRKNFNIPAKSFNIPTIVGKIKENIYNKKYRLDDAIFSAYYNINMNDSEILQVLIGAQIYKDKFPAGVKIANFHKFFNERDIVSNII